ncbi:MAG: HAD-IIB family hydrolase [Bryobacteraceae bacterium]|nr:HAD-IIB family hydrolase [Bryobacteraceae bacterium]
MLVIFSDLDGTMLDARTYSYEEAKPALARLRQKKIPLILCTSKTRVEVNHLRNEMGCAHPYLAENGAVAVIPASYFPPGSSDGMHVNNDLVVRFGSSYQSVVTALRAASLASGVPVRGFSQMTAKELAELTGLDLPSAARALQRDHDEPFLIAGPHSAEPLLQAITALGKRWTRGGRFFHVTDQLDKGAAARYLIRRYRQYYGEVTTVALGDAMNDLPLLRVCDRAIVVQSDQATALLEQLPGAELTALPGPRGWSHAVLRLPCP